MEQWKLEEIILLQSDIALFLQQLGLDPARIKTVSDFAEHQGACSEEEINFLNAFSPHFTVTDFSTEIED